MRKKIIIHTVVRYINSWEDIIEQGRKHPLDTPERMIERREREGEWER